MAFLGGAITGVAVALLTAPQSGRETRGQLLGWTHEARDKATRLPHAVREASTRATHAAREAFSEALKESERGDRA
jgi:gas vesicle protein